MYLIKDTGSIILSHLISIYTSPQSGCEVTLQLDLSKAL